MPGASLPHHGLHRGLWGISAPVPGALAPPQPSLTVGVAAFSRSHILTPRSSCRFCCSFLPLLKHAVSETLQLPTGSGLASGGSVLKPAHTGLIEYKGKLLAVSQRIHPCYRNLAVQNPYTHEKSSENNSLCLTGFEHLPDKQILIDLKHPLF